MVLRASRTVRDGRRHGGNRVTPLVTVRARPHAQLKTMAGLDGTKQLMYDASCGGTLYAQLGR